MSLLGNHCRHLRGNDVGLTAMPPPPPPEARCEVAEKVRRLLIMLANMRITIIALCKSPKMSCRFTIMRSFDGQETHAKEDIFVFFRNRRR